MKRPFRCILLFLLPCFAAKASGNTPDSLHFNGMIGEKYAFTMVFTIAGNKVSGWYYYNTKKQKINITGTLQQRQFEIVEYVGTDTTGFFSGSMPDQFHISGNWRKEKDNFDKSKFFEMMEIKYAADMNQTITAIENNTAAKKINIISSNEQGEMILNETYLKNCTEKTRAILAYYSTQSGSECWWEADTPDKSYTNLSCRFTKALGLGLQCSDKQKNIIKKWFIADKVLLEDAGNCYYTPYTATSQSTFTELSLTLWNDSILVKYLVNGVNIRENYSWNFNGIGIYKIEPAKISRTFYK
jgi:hypothetical protein